MPLDDGQRLAIGADGVYGGVEPSVRAYKAGRVGFAEALFAFVLQPFQAGEIFRRASLGGQAGAVGFERQTNFVHVAQERLVDHAHDLTVAHHIADRVAVMYLGVIVETALKTALSAAAQPDPGAPRTRILLEGEVPSPSAIPPGCRFHTRYPLAQPVCRIKAPALRTVAPNHQAACHFAAPFPIPAA